MDGWFGQEEPDLSSRIRLPEVRSECSNQKPGYGSIFALADQKKPEASPSLLALGSLRAFVPLLIVKTNAAVVDGIRDFIEISI